MAHYQPLQVHAEAGTLDDFYESYAVPSIREQIREVVRAEGPVSLMLTAKRIAEFWGFGRVGARGRLLEFEVSSQPMMLTFRSLSQVNFSGWPPHHQRNTVPSECPARTNLA